MQAQQVLRVHDEQLLVLLLVMATEEEDRCALVVQAGAEQAGDRVLDVLPVAGDLARSGPRDQTALCPGVPWTDALVVGVEQVAKPVVEGLVAGGRSEQELLVEPRGVGSMPLGGLASGIDWAVWSSAASGAASISVSARLSVNAAWSPRPTSRIAVVRAVVSMVMSGADYRRMTRTLDSLAPDAQRSTGLSSSASAGQLMTMLTEPSGNRPSEPTTSAAAS